MLKIGDFSKLSRISIRMLRHYDQMKLLEPVHIDPLTGYRFYSHTQLPLAAQITSLKAMGFGLAAIGELIGLQANEQEMKHYLLQKKLEVSDQARRAEEQLLMLETALRHLEEEHMMNYPVVVKEMPARKVASVRQIIPTYAQEGQLWECMMKEAPEIAEWMAEPCDSLAIFHDEGYKEQDVDVEIQISVRKLLNDTENVRFKEAPAQLIASSTYQGSYEQISLVNQAVANWIEENNYDMGEGMFSIYHVSPSTEKNPDLWVTEVCYPIKKR